MNKGQGPMSFMLNDMANLVKTGDANWEQWFGADKSKWIFNTQCCATQTNFRMAKCAAPTCENKCDDPANAATCSNKKCSDLVKQYPCASYYAPGKPYAGWCDKECGYGACAKPYLTFLEPAGRPLTALVTPL